MFTKKEKNKKITYSGSGTTIVSKVIIDNDLGLLSFYGNFGNCLKLKQYHQGIILRGSVSVSSIDISITTNRVSSITISSLIDTLAEYEPIIQNIKDELIASVKISITRTKKPYSSKTPNLDLLLNTTFHREQANPRKRQLFDEDRTNPNKCFVYQKERYIEKKILSLIEKEDITAQEHRTLCLLTRLNVSDPPLICKDIWIKIPTNYEAFKNQQTEINSAIKHRYSSTDAKFCYKSKNNSMVFLPKNKIKEFDKVTKAAIDYYCFDKGYFDDSDLHELSLENERNILKFAPTYRYLTLSERQQEQDASSWEQVGYFENDEHEKGYTEAKRIEDDLKYLSNVIRWIRSFAEYSDPSLFQKFERELAVEMIKIEAEIEGSEVKSSFSNSMF